MKNKDIKEVYVDDLIALCHIIYGFGAFDLFNQKLRRLISSKNAYSVFEFAKNLQQLVKGEFGFYSRKIKQFYEENKEVIDIINEYSYIVHFICQNYNDQGEFGKESYYNLDFFYQYILNNRGNLNQILSLLEKIKELGFQKFEFGDKLDFSNAEYAVSTDIYYSKVTYLDNIEVIPNYENDRVQYKTIGSNYKIEIEFGSAIDFMFGRGLQNKTIIVNSLLFDTKRLPRSITKENTHDEIIKLKSEQEEKCIAIRNSVDLSVSIEDLCSQLYSTNRVISDLEQVQSKSELLQILSIIKENVEKLENMSMEYNDSISKEDPTITKETLEKAKKRYLRRREDSSIDLC